MGVNEQDRLHHDKGFIIYDKHTTKNLILRINTAIFWEADGDRLS